MKTKLSKYETVVKNINDCKNKNLIKYFKRFISIFEVKIESHRDNIILFIFYKGTAFVKYVNAQNAKDII